MRQQIREAVAEATRRGKLRPNSVDSITGKNSGDNLGPRVRRSSTSISGSATRSRSS
jgi:tartrate dehydratase alpha subunit/fumarate hydratase class I-like protein